MFSVSNYGGEGRPAAPGLSSMAIGATMTAQPAKIANFRCSSSRKTIINMLGNPWEVGVLPLFDVKNSVVLLDLRGSQFRTHQKLKIGVG